MQNSVRWKWLENYNYITYFQLFCWANALISANTHCLFDLFWEPLHLIWKIDYCSLCLPLSNEYTSWIIKHIKVEITINFFLLLVIISLKQIKGKIKLQYPRKKTIILSTSISKLKWTESVLPDAKGRLRQYSFRTGRSCLPCGLDYESWRKKLTVKKSSITLLSRRVSRQDSVGFSITFCEDSNIAI